MIYKTYASVMSETNFIKRINEDGSISYIPLDPANSDYQEYLKSLEETN